MVIKVKEREGNKIENLCAAVQICKVHVARVSHTAGAFSSLFVNRWLAQG